MKRIMAACVLVSASAGAQENPATMRRIGTVDARFQSYNVEMVEVTGGRFWKPYGSAAVAAPMAAANGTPGGIDPALFEQRPPIDLSNARLRKLAAALGPAYIRVSGSWQNTTFFQDSDAPAPPSAPSGFSGVLTRAEWKGVVEFAKAVDAKIVTSFATSAGTRDQAGVWTPAEAQKFIAYNATLGSPIAAAEFMNEPTFASAAGVPAGYDAAAYGKDFAVFQPWFRKSLPHAILLGPGSVGEGIDFVPMKVLPSKELLAATGANPVDVFSYHFYGGVSSRCAQGPAAKSGTSEAAALGEDWLGRTDTVEAFYAKLRDEYAPGKPMWVTETGQTACGGDRWASTFADTFRYVDQMGSLAKLGVKTIMHNTLAASDYALIDGPTLTPRPNYWAALLWHNTMGTTVLNAGKAMSGDVHVYAACMKGHAGGVTLLALNLDQRAEHGVDVGAAAMQYTLRSVDPGEATVQLNGKDLALSPTGDLPALTGVRAAPGRTMLPAGSVSFFTMAGAANPACK